MAAPATPAKPVEPVKPARKSRAKAPENESKSDKFKRLANHRVPRAIKIMRSIGMLGNKSQYESTDQQTAAILQAIQDAYASMKGRLLGASQEEKSFKL